MLKSETVTLTIIVVIICSQIHLTLFFLRGVQRSTSRRLIAGAEQHQKFLEKLELDRRDRLELL